MPPKTQKYRKQFRGRMRGKAYRGSNIDFGEYGLKSLACGWLSEKQIEAARRTISQATSRGGKVWIRAFADKPVTGKGAGVRMGSGKGEIQKYVAVITPGKVLFEIAGIEKTLAFEALRKASAKLPFKTLIVERSR